MRWLALGSFVHWAGTMMPFVGADVLHRAAMMGGHALLGKAMSFPLLLWTSATNMVVLVFLVQLGKKGMLLEYGSAGARRWAGSTRGCNRQSLAALLYPGRLRQQCCGQLSARLCFRHG